MAKKNLPKIVVITDIGKLDTPTMVSTSKGIKTTGDPDVGGVNPADGTLHAQADTLQTIHTNRQTTPPTATADDEIKQRNIVIRTYKKMAVYVQGVAEDVAVAAGDVTAGETVVLRVGFKLKKKAVLLHPDFTATSPAPGTAELKKTKAKKGAEGHLWRYGTTTDKGIPPAASALKPVLVTLQAHLLINDLPSKTVIGIQHASVTSVKPSKKTKTTDTKTSKTISKIDISKAGHPVFSHTADDHYQWTDFIYVVIS